MDYNFAHKTDQAIIEFSKFNIEFSEKNKSYLFNNQWINIKIDSYHNEQIDRIKNLLHIQLNAGLNHKEYLQNLLDILNKRIIWLLENNYNLPIFFENYSIKKTDYDYLLPARNSNKSSFKKFFNNSPVPNSSEMRIFWFLELFKKEFNDFKDELDFEKGLLLYSIKSYRHALSILSEYIKSLHQYVEFTDFKSLNLVNSNEVKQTQRNVKICNFNLDKKNIAHLFRILIEEKLIVFDEFNDSKNLTEMKSFVEKNFTYQNKKKERMAIDKLNREYSEASWRLEDVDKIRHNKLIDKLVLTLQTRKANLKY
ncbi:hypothetical protein [Flavivirga rizhaonensis]|uniref:Uncharacterized protein n=1 Tax=Flavivirga rizhaonensis TaxID=2559571 RepID=A0A4S1E0J4_9FLAO|nr:hypothetical protein [Flavivirga rizhaonensis]TGV03402.1 hypothetical protein EM932_06935 [Flavivirga rizhaonensis]